MHHFKLVYAFHKCVRPCAFTCDYVTVINSAAQLTRRETQFKLGRGQSMITFCIKRHTHAQCTAVLHAQEPTAFAQEQ